MQPLIQSVDQLGFVVRDLDACVRMLADEYGVGPWTIVRFGDPTEPNTISIADTVLDGQPVGVYTIRCAVCDMPNGVQLEVIEPLDDKSVFAQYLREHGPGLQHISVVTNDGFDAVFDHIRASGHFDRGQIATVDTNEICVFADFRKELGTYLELHKRPETFTLPTITPEFYPPSGKMPEGNTPAFTAIDRIGVVVEDAYEAAERMQEEFGVGAWNINELRNCTVEGTPVSSVARLAGCDALNLCIRLMEPIDRTGHLAERLARHGNDVCHVSMESAHLADAKEKLRDDHLTLFGVEFLPHHSRGAQSE